MCSYFSKTKSYDFRITVDTDNSICLFKYDFKHFSLFIFVLFYECFACMYTTYGPNVMDIRREN